MATLFNYQHYLKNPEHFIVYILLSKTGFNVYISIVAKIYFLNLNGYHILRVTFQGLFKDAEKKNRDNYTTIFFPLENVNIFTSQK